jgi:hypothetical protein
MHTITIFTAVLALQVSSLSKHTFAHPVPTGIAPPQADIIDLATAAGLNTSATYVPSVFQTWSMLSKPNDAAMSSEHELNKTIDTEVARLGSLDYSPLIDYGHCIDLKSAVTGRRINSEKAYDTGTKLVTKGMAVARELAHRLQITHKGGKAMRGNVEPQVQRCGHGEVWTIERSCCVPQQVLRAKRSELFMFKGLLIDIICAFFPSLNCVDP